MSDNTQVAVVRDISSVIRSDAMQRQIQASLPPSLSPDRFTAVTITAINHNPDLLKADRQTLYNAVVKCAQEGLLPDGQDAVLNIYNTNVAPKGQPPQWVKKIQYQRMVGGVLKQFTKAGIDAYAESVYENDEFLQANDENGQHVIHRPARLGKPRGERIGAFAVAKLPSGRVVVQVMTMEDLQRARAASKSGDSGPWKAWPERMEQKSVLHRLRKRVAIVDEAAAAELKKIDEEFDEDETPEPSPVPVQPVPTPQATTERPRGLQAVVDQATGEVTDAEIVTPDTGGNPEDPGPGPEDII